MSTNHAECKFTLLQCVILLFSVDRASLADLVGHMLATLPAAWPVLSLFLSLPFVLSLYADKLALGISRVARTEWGYSWTVVSARVPHLQAHI
jgi:hypothetical protein